jgi:23S rRNA pseudouridine2605 synthase
MLERLQKIIAHAGLASRRHAEELITSGLVTVNGQTITELGSKADPSRDHIKVTGKLLRPSSERVYLLLNKPTEVVSTMNDPEGRPSLRDFLQGVSERVYPVGRLEYHSSGLVFLTNDGDIANRMLKSHRLPQIYHLKLKSLLTFAEIETLSRSTGARISRLRSKEMPWYEVTLSEARQDALRNKLFQTGHPVEKMRRVGIGNLPLESLAPGRYRTLSPAEVATLSRVLDGQLEPTVVVRRHSIKPPRQSKHKGPLSSKRSGPNRNFGASKRSGPNRNSGSNNRSGSNRNFSASKRSDAGRNVGASKRLGPNRNSGASERSDPSRNLGRPKRPGAKSNFGTIKKNGPTRNSDASRKSGTSSFPRKR